MADDAFARLVRNAGSVTSVGDSAPIFSGSVNGRQPYPLDQWNPSNCGFVDIAIDRDGRWFHEGGEIHRKALVKLFSKVLKRDSDGVFWLETPVEKGRIEVEDAPFIATALTVDYANDATLDTHPALRFTTNVDDHVPLDALHRQTQSTCLL